METKQKAENSRSSFLFHFLFNKVRQGKASSVCYCALEITLNFHYKSILKYSI